MKIQYICKNDSSHVFDEPTSDFWCPLCPIDQRSMLHMLENDGQDLNDSESNEGSTIVSDLETTTEVVKNDTSEVEIEEPNVTNSETADIVEAQEIIEIKPPVLFTIGNQTWMLDYLKISELEDNEKIWLATNEKDWMLAQSSKLPAFCYPNGDKELAENIGYLYNWYAAKAITRLMKNGFQVPNVEDILLLNKNLQISNETFFLPDYALEKVIHIEHRLPMSTYANGTNNRCFWTVDEHVHYTAFAFLISKDKKDIELRKIDKNAGYFIRCIQK